MVQTLISEERLASLEAGVAGIVTQLANLHQQTSEHVATQQNTLQLLIEQQKILEQKLDEILGRRNVDNVSVDKTEARLKRDDHRQIEYPEKGKETTSSSVQCIEGYVNWNGSHDELQNQAYVSLKDVTNLRNNIGSSDFNLGDIVKVFNSPVQINKTKRFPADGAYLNIKAPQIKNHVNYILGDVEMRGDKVLIFCRLNELLSDVDYIILKKGEEVHDIVSFEDTYKLKWLSGVKSSETDRNLNQVEKLDNNDNENTKDTFEKAENVERSNAICKKEWHGYINWEKEHDILKRHSYVPVLLFMDHFEAFSDYKEVNEEMSQNVLSILNSAIKVDKLTRFPSDGLYLNINMPCIQYSLNSVLKCISNRSAEPVGSYSEFLTLINKLIAVVNQIMEKDQGGIHNDITFEEKYKLTWVDEIEDNTDLEKGLPDTNLSLALKSFALSRFGGLTQNHGYTNWSDEHESIKLHLYVPVNTFREDVEGLKTKINIWSTEVKYEVVNKIMIWSNTFKVDKDTRFPSNGVYVNVNSSLVKYYLDKIFGDLREDIMRVPQNHQINHGFAKQGLVFGASSSHTNISMPCAGPTSSQSFPVQQGGFAATGLFGSSSNTNTNMTGSNQNHQSQQLSFGAPAASVKPAGVQVANISSMDANQSQQVEAQKSFGATGQLFGNAPVNQGFGTRPQTFGYNPSLQPNVYRPWMDTNKMNNTIRDLLNIIPGNFCVNGELTVHNIMSFEDKYKLKWVDKI